MSEKYQWFNGLKFTRDEKTGYYLNATHRKRIHRYVWEFHNGEIPKGHAIHHIDHDKSNNDIANLKIMQGKKHISMHMVELNNEDHSGMVARMEHARIYASEWHGSKEGKEWHKLHYDEMKQAFHAKKEFVCKCCGTIFFAIREGFCSNKCKSAWRRKSGVDNETRICPQCGKEFSTNKYSDTKCCSKKCANKLLPRLPQLRKNKVN